MPVRRPLCILEDVVSMRRHGKAGYMIMWNGRRYCSLDWYLKEKFGQKLYKLTLDGGMTCPNRDGSISYRGCIFCSDCGSGEFSASNSLGTDKQLEFAKSLISDKYSGDRFIAYFQSYTNTYAPADYLRSLYVPLINRDDIAVLDIATRPDCLETEKLNLISELAKIKPVWVELGLQSASDKTAQLINRGYPTEIYAQAVKNLHLAGAEVITHMIIGLPYETRSDMLDTVRYVDRCGSNGIKLHLLHIIEGTELAGMYADGKVNTLSEEEYVSVVCDIIGVLPRNMVIHRLTGDGDRNKLIAPKWSGNKRRVLNLINHELKVRNIIQGCLR